MVSGWLHRWQVPGRTRGRRSELADPDRWRARGPELGDRRHRGGEGGSTGLAGLTESGVESRCA
jgi:hypothetical protein